MKEFSFRTRRKDIGELDGKHFQVAVIGGGITGAGIVNILAENGIKTVLFERSDFAAGTSSGSSKLIHGGLRYLQQGKLRLTRELLKEREYLIKNTDIVSKLDFRVIIDDYSWGKGELTLGIFLYNILAGHFRVQRMIRDDLGLPGVKGYFPYYDGVTEDTEMVMYNIAYAQQKGASCFNYTEVEAISRTDKGISIQYHDKVDNRVGTVSADLVVNCGGPWAKEIRELYDRNNPGKLSLSKGIHIVVDRTDLNLNYALVFRSHIDGRQLFIIPREKITLIGTTDKFVKSPDDFSIPDEDVDYLVESAKRLFPKLDRSMVVYAFAGIRPLFGSGDDPGKISRDFHIERDSSMIDIYGGKLTSYRAISRKVAKLVASELKINIRTRGLPVLDYSRPRGEDRINYEAKYECPVYPDDIKLRREAAQIYNPKGQDQVGKQAEAVLKSMER